MTDSYKPEFWYWEVVELVRKLVLTGVFVVVLHGSLAQLAMATLVMAAFTLAVAYLEPYAEKHPGDRMGAIAVFTHAQLFAVFFMSLVLKAVANAGTDGKHAANSFAVGLDNGMLGGLLIFTCVSTLIMLGYSVYTDGKPKPARATGEMGDVGNWIPSPPGWEQKKALSLTN